MNTVMYADGNHNTGSPLLWLRQVAGHETVRPDTEEPRTRERIETATWMALSFTAGKILPDAVH